MIQLATKDQCTGCGACAYKCPKQCIQMKENEIGIVLPTIDDASCIECHSCEKSCPILNPVTYNNPKESFAAWAKNEEDRRTSASGGVAVAAYQYALQKGYKAVGAVQKEDFSVCLSVAETLDQISPFKNSKYVFSSGYDVFPQIDKLLKQGKSVIVIALPCQVAAMRKLFNNDNLFLIDVICHGTTPYSYLLQHIESIERKLKQKTVKMSFRDPAVKTYTYTFTLYNEKEEQFYARRTKDGDTYQFGYHRAVSYRENCFHCKFAKPERVADITLGDYSGLGKMAPCDFPLKKVSCVLVYTEKGKRFISELISENKIEVKDRPLMEPIQGNSQLQQPSAKKEARFQFEKKIISSNGDFEIAIAPVLKSYVRREKINKIITIPFRIFRKIMNLIKK